MKIAKKTAIVASLLAISIFTEQASAGSVSGPYVIWANLGNADGNIMDSIIKNYLDSGDDFCWQKGSSIMYMKDRPAEISDALIHDGLILKNKAAIKKLNRLLTHKFSPGWEGFDGIIVYTDQGGAKFTSFTAGSKKIKSSRIPDISNIGDIQLTLCDVMPPITRAP
jgi:hypothetical protein